jgi:hypothetical protein
MFEDSFNATLERYRKLLGEFGAGKLELANDNFDTGETTGPGKYGMNDNTYAKLLDKLSDEKFAGALPALRANILEFFRDLNAPYATKRDPKAWAKLQTELDQLKAAPPADAPAAATASSH